jgi:hypothetical protein
MVPLPERKAFSHFVAGEVELVPCSGRIRPLSLTANSRVVSSERVKKKKKFFTAKVPDGCGMGRG